MSLSRKTLYGFLAGIAIVFFLYFPGLYGGFFFDDTHVLVENYDIRLKTLSWESIEKAAKSFLPGGRQLSMISFALTYYFLGDFAWIFKLTNLVLHFVNAFLLYLVCRQIFNILSAQNRLTTLGEREIALICALSPLLWAMQPINLSSVLYVSQRMTLLATFFILVGILTYFRFRQIERASFFLWICTLSVSGLLTLLGYLSKENGVLLPVFLILIEVAFFQSYRFSSNDRGKVFKRYLFGFALLVVVGFVFIMLNSTYFQEVFGGYKRRPFGLEERIFTQFRALSFYLSQIIVPNIRELSMWHDDFALSTSLLSPWTTLPSTIFIFSLLIATIFLLHYAPVMGFGLGVFFIGHSLESTFFGLELVHEHRNYLASFGISLTLIYMIIAVLTMKKTIKVSLLVLLFVWHGNVLAQRAYIWGDNFRKTTHEALSHPESPSAIFALAKTYYEFAKKGDLKAEQEAMMWLARSREIEKEGVSADILSILLSESETVDIDLQWIESAASKIEKHPWIPTNIRSVKGLLLCIQDKVCTENAALVAPIFESAGRTETPQMITSAAIYTFEHLKDRERAIDYFLKAEKTAAERSYYLMNTARVYYKIGNYEEACIRYETLSKRDSYNSKRIRSDIEELGQYLENICESPEKSD
ncbi:MAG: hypothetical protein AAF353_00435 [Pseudomonadota bacterium]